MKFLTGFLFILICSGQAKAIAYDCDSDCYGVARFRYSCPTFNNPARKCWGRNPVKFAACEADKALSCKLWNEAVDFFSTKTKSMLQNEFNAANYQKAEYSGETAQYMAYCTGAAAAACATVGAQLGGPYGAILAGAGGSFVSYQICKQSTTW